MSKTLSLNELLGDRSVTASNAARKRRDECEARQEASAFCGKSYREGEAAAYNDAAMLARNELMRLQNLFQNGSLTISDFRTY